MYTFIYIFVFSQLPEVQFNINIWIIFSRLVCGLQALMPHSKRDHKLKIHHAVKSVHQRRQHFASWTFVLSQVIVMTQRWWRVMLGPRRSGMISYRHFFVIIPNPSLYSLYSSLNQDWPLRLGCVHTTARWLNWPGHMSPRFNTLQTQEQCLC